MKRNEAIFCRYKAYNHYYDKLCVVQYLFMAWRSTVCIFALDFHRNKNFLFISFIWECLLLGCLWHTVMEWSEVLCRKKTNLEGVGCATPPSMGPICAGRGRVISGRLANRLESRFGTNAKLLRGVNWPYISIQYSMMLLVCAGGSRSNNALPWSPREILQLLLRVKSLAVQERNMLFVDRVVK